MAFDFVAQRLEIGDVVLIDLPDEDGQVEATVIREKERFSQRLTLLYADGRIALLSEKPSEKAPSKRGEDAQRSPEDGNTDVCPANS